MIFKFVWLSLLILIALCDTNLAKVVDYQPQQIHIAYGGELLRRNRTLTLLIFNILSFCYCCFFFFVHRK